MKTIPGQRFRIYEYNGEMFMYGSIDGVEITRRPPTASEMRNGRRQIEKYTKLQWMVHSVYPYAQRVAELMAEVDRDLSSLDGNQAQKEYIKQREQALFDRYEDDFRKMSRTQGKILIKLVYRQTGVSTYDLIKETKSGATAFFWQGIGRIFGMNLKEAFDPEEDQMIDAIVGDLERGGYNICYKSYDYRLRD
ncbi:MAG: DUF4294 domain-containing protein [Bacteroidia bacterium]|nr:DUF4294 domain-containing protein [Bacteroidia bacterium]